MFFKRSMIISFEIASFLELVYVDQSYVLRFKSWHTSSFRNKLPWFERITAILPQFFRQKESHKFSSLSYRDKYSLMSCKCGVIDRRVVSSNSLKPLRTRPLQSTIFPRSHISLSAVPDMLKQRCSTNRHYELFSLLHVTCNKKKKK